jgi:hypothetical protein
MRDAMKKAREDNLLGSMELDPVSVRIDMNLSWEDEKYPLSGGRYSKHRPRGERPSDIFRKAEMIEKEYLNSGTSAAKENKKETPSGVKEKG